MAIVAAGTCARGIKHTVYRGDRRGCNRRTPPANTRSRSMKQLPPPPPICCQLNSFGVLHHIGFRVCRNNVDVIAPIRDYFVKHSKGVRLRIEWQYTNKRQLVCGTVCKVSMVNNSEHVLS